MKVIKKLLKIAGLYLLFGVITAFIASVLGLFTGMTGLLQLSPIEYIAFAVIIFGLCWLPYSISIIVSMIKDGLNYFSLYGAVILICIAIILFLLLSLRIIFKKSK